MKDAPASATVPATTGTAPLAAGAGLLALAAALLTGLGETVLLGTAGGRGSALAEALVLGVSLAWPALLLFPLVHLGRWLSSTIRRHPGAALGGTLGALLGLRAAEAAATRLFSTLHRADLAGLLLALASALLVLLALAGGALLGRALQHRADQGGSPAGRTAPGLVLLLLALWAAWRLYELELLPHLPRGLLPLGGLLALLLLIETAHQPLTTLARRAPSRHLTALLLAAPFVLTPAALLLSLPLYPAAPRQQQLLEERTLVARLLLPLLRRAWDADGDGSSPGWGGGDCRDGEAAVHPGAEDIPGDGIDQDCRGGDEFADEGAPEQADPLGLATLQPLRLPLPPEHPPFRNVVLLVIDALRLDATAAGGASPSATPQLDRLASRSVQFTGALSAAPGTWPAVPALLTGRYPSALSWSGPGPTPGLSPANLTLPELLEARGLRTAALVSGYLRWRLPGLGQGFERFDSVLPREASTDQRADTSPLFVEQATRLLAELGTQRFFLYVHFVDPHAPYVEHPGFPGGESDRERYLGEVAYTDHHLGQLLERLAALPGTDETLLIVTADHGEEFGEHGGSFHASQLYQESLRVPLVVHGRGLAPASVGTPVSLVDLVPTVLDLLGQDEAVSGLQGRSLVPDLLGRPPAGAEQRPLFAELGPWVKDRRTLLLEGGRWALHHRPTQGAAFELYDLQADPREQINLVASQPEEATRLMRRLAAFERLSRRALSSQPAEKR